MGKPQFTCLMTCYEQEHYIYEALDSLFAQDYENIQLILVDDGSKVFHEDRVKEYIYTHKGPNITDVMVEVNPQNLGIVKTYNRAIPWVSGKYLNLFDGDDIYHNSHVISRFVEYFEALPETSYVLCAQMLMCGKTFDEKLYLYCNCAFMEDMNRMSAHEQFIQCCTADYYPKSSLVVRTELYRKESLYDESLFVIDDWTMVVRTLQKGYQFQYRDFIACDHRFGGVSSGSLITPRKLRFLQEHLLVLDKYVLPYVKKFSFAEQMRIFRFYQDSFMISAKTAGNENARLSNRFFCKYSIKYTFFYCMTVLSKLIRIGAHFGMHLAKMLSFGALVFFLFSLLVPFHTFAVLAGGLAKISAITVLSIIWLTILCKILRLFPLPH